MIGITSYGAYIPWYRMDRKIIFQQMGWFNAANAAVARGEKAVANHDEDAITMAYAAAANCLNGGARDQVDGLYMASLSFPFAQRQNAGIVSTALDLRSDIRTADFGGCLKSGTTALLSALDSVASGNTASMMACASDCRVGKPGSAQEYIFGDGAAAILVGGKNVIAEFKGSFSVSYDFIDWRRLANERFEHGWEERWIREEGYMKIIPQAAQGLAKKYGLKPGDFAKVIVACPNDNVLKGLAKKIGVLPEQMQDNLVSSVGDTGAAMALMMLVSALEDAKPEDKILVLSFGFGSDALYFEVTDAIEKVKRTKNGVKAHLAHGEALNTYARYQAYRDLVPLELGIRGESVPPTSMSVLHRQGNTVSALVGVKCKACGTPQYPKHSVCVNPLCGAMGQMEPYRFSDKTGRVVSFTADYLAFSYDPPQVYGFIDFPEGGRLFMDFTDLKADSLKVGMPAVMTFRRAYSDQLRGYSGYYWKAKAVIQETNKMEE